MLVRHLVPPLTPAIGIAPPRWSIGVQFHLRRQLSSMQSKVTRGHAFSRAKAKKQMHFTPSETGCQGIRVADRVRLSRQIGRGLNGKDTRDRPNRPRGFDPQVWAI